MKLMKMSYNKKEEKPRNIRNVKQQKNNTLLHRLKKYHNSLQLGIEFFQHRNIQHIHINKIKPVTSIRVCQNFVINTITFPPQSR